MGEKAKIRAAAASFCNSKPKSVDEPEKTSYNGNTVYVWKACAEAFERGNFL